MKVIVKAILFFLGGWPFGRMEFDPISRMQIEPARKPLVTCGSCGAGIELDTAVCPECGFRFGGAEP